jgi:pimeloyl-ACP methyl ester carboxylesterase
MIPNFRLIDTGKVVIRAAVAGEGPLVILVHGFPESWYSWRHQIGPLAAKGYKVCAIDVRGYGGSSRPPLVADYAMQDLIDDLLAIASSMQPDRPAILVGHDWGAPIVWNAALTQPHRFSAVCGMSVAYAGVPERPSIDFFAERSRAKNRFFYQVYFQSEGIAEAELEKDVRAFLRRFYYALSGDAPPDCYPTRKPASAKLLDEMVDPPVFPAWLQPADLDYYVAEFNRSGLRGPLNRYRNHVRDLAFLTPFRGRKISQPALFIVGDRDPAFGLSGDDDAGASARSAW